MAMASKSPVFEKLNLKDESEIVVVNSPKSFHPALAALENIRIVTSPARAKVIDFALVFATKQKEVDAAAASIPGKGSEDVKLWIAYPKQSSKRYTCEFNRDSGWQSLGAAGFEPVRMVAIDEDWSALRFRRAEKIKELKRPAARTLSAAGRKKAAKKKS